MMNVNARKVTAALMATGLFAFSSAAMATNGYFTHGVGTESKAMAGSGVGSSENMGGIAVATNPALAVFSDEKWQIGLAVFSPMRSYEVRGGLGGQLGAFSLSEGEYDSKNEAFPIPYIAKNWKFDNGGALSAVFYGRGGMNTEWDSGQSAFFDPAPGNPNSPGVINLPGLYGGGKAGVDLMQAFLNINYSGKIGDSFAWGLGPVVAVQMFEATGLANFAGYTETFANAFPGYFGSCLVGGGDQATCQLVAQAQAAGDVTSLTGNGHSTSVGYGVSTGIWFGNEKASFGLAYQSQIEMEEFDEYSDLFAQAGGFDIPSTLKAGLSFKTSDSVVLNFDVEHIGYSDIDSVANPVMNLLTGCFTANPQVTPETSGCLGAESGAGFGWEDVTVYKLGVAFKSSDTSTWRFGYSYGEQPIPSSEMLFNILAPGVMEQHLTFGWTGLRPNGNVMSFSLMYAPETRVSGASTFDPFQTIELKMTQLELEFAYRF
jgi:long-chain fatty acid transport protein